MSFAHSLHESFTWVSPRMEVAMIVTVYRMCTKASMKRGSCVGVNVVVLDARKQPPSSRRAMTNIVNIINSSSEVRFPFHNFNIFRQPRRAAAFRFLKQFGATALYFGALSMVLLVGLTMSAPSTSEPTPVVRSGGGPRSHEMMTILWQPLSP